MKTLKFVNLVASMLFLLGMSQQSQAAFVLTLDDLSTAGIDAIISDNAPIGTPTQNVGLTTQNDGLAGLGVINDSVAIGAFNIAVTTGVSKPQIGPAPTIDLNSVVVSSLSAGDLLISLTDTNFISPVGGLRPFKWIFGGTAGGTITLGGAIDPSNNEFGVGTPLGPEVFSGAFSDTVFANANLAGAYSMTLTALIHHTAGGQITSFDSNLTEVPVPAAVWLFGSGLMGLFGFSSRKKTTGIAAA